MLNLTCIRKLFRYLNPHILVKCIRQTPLRIHRNFHSSKASPPEQSKEKIAKEKAKHPTLLYNYHIPAQNMKFHITVLYIVYTYICRGCHKGETCIYALLLGSSVTTFVDYCRKPKMYMTRVPCTTVHN